MYLIWPEMVSSRLLRFDDQAENYWAWKASFCSSTQDLCLTPRAELLCKWLGPKSSEHAKRIRAVHIQNAATSVKMVWHRLKDCYGSPEVIENALLKKVEDFPKTTSRENHKLRELSDILLDLEADKRNVFSTWSQLPWYISWNYSSCSKVATSSAWQVGFLSIPLQRRPPHILPSKMSFRSKPLDERKAYLKDKYICYFNQPPGQRLSTKCALWRVQQWQTRNAITSRSCS